jgi:hypothetical protein
MDEKKIPDEYAHIKGWGIDADTRNDPTYPMKKRNGAPHSGDNWTRPTQQDINIEVNHSVERPNISAVFGTDVPPSGLSGLIRRQAFKKTENQYSHWLPLLLADRVNMVEGILDDLSRGRIPNILAEKGLGADWKYNRPRLLRKIATGATLLFVAYALLRSKDSE